MIKTFWTELEPRERTLILLAGIIVFAVFLYQFVYVPSVQSKARAQRAYADALAENVTIAAAVRNSTGSYSDNNQQPLQTVVTNLSDLFGITITRLIPAENAGLNLWLEAESPETVYAWLSELERSYGVRVGKATLRRNSDEQSVNVNVYLSRSE